MASVLSVARRDAAEARGGNGEATRGRAAAVAAFAAVALAAAGTQAQAQMQVPLLRVRLAADPGKSGPPGIVWVRERVLAAAADAPAFGPLEVRIDAEQHVQIVAAAEGPPAGLYVAAELRHGGLRAQIRATADGIEDWEIEGTPGAGRLTSLVRRIGLDRLRGTVTLDLPVLAGNVGGFVDEADPLATLLRLGPGECGDVTLLVQVLAPQHLRVRGRSDGGLLLPALLLVLADLRARPDPQDLQTPLAVGEHEPWQMLAAAACDSWREEAAHQLARIGTAPAQDALLRLLHADDDARLAAMAALLQRGAQQALPQLLAAVDQAQPETAALAAIATHTWTPARAGVLPGLRSPAPTPRPFPVRWIPFAVLALASLVLLLVTSARR